MNGLSANPSLLDPEETHSKKVSSTKDFREITEIKLKQIINELKVKLRIATNFVLDKIFT